METGELIGAGRTADVFALDGDRVVRRYRDGEDATGEAAVMAYLAEHGYPVPAVWPGAEPRELVMQRLSGPTMREALVAGTLSGDEAGEVLADLLLRLHAVPPRVGADPAHRIIHLDLHPENVFLTPDGPVVIDWATAQEGPPGLDTAMAALILAQAALTMPAAAEVARSVLPALVRRLGGTDGMLLPEARARRAANPTLTHEETAALDEAVTLILAAGADAGDGVLQ
ncbi:phosphotransferase [Streptomyces sp. KAU_LT]|uniref:phosphotransferase n=1 Tax=Streptomyces sp. KAU_LT TaxID=3046669 RepID=UPI0024B6CBEC|nr:phosphotransferase [Streptomyces sp. KAU_LT]MDI9835298.1 phosphotransferase [Streptomyces sp. KAU_LT]